MLIEEEGRGRVIIEYARPEDFDALLDDSHRSDSEQ